jgi:outer membrane protein OmpA-like peptidoglycan-associated protein
LAQTPGTAGPVSLSDLFNAPDSFDLKGNANAALNAAIVNADMRQCRTQKANIKVVMAKGNDLFQQALGQARCDVIAAVLKQQGVADERYAVAYGGIGAKDDVQVEYRAPPPIR